MTFFLASDRPALVDDAATFDRPRPPADKMNQRPTSITVIAWLLMVSAASILVISTVYLNNPIVQELMAMSPIPIPAQYVMTYLELAVGFISGVAVLKGHNWGRWLYVVWFAIGFIIGLAVAANQNCPASANEN